MQITFAQGATRPSTKHGLHQRPALTDVDRGGGGRTQSDRTDQRASRPRAPAAFGQGDGPLSFPTYSDGLHRQRGNFVQIELPDEIDESRARSRE